MAFGLGLGTYLAIAGVAASGAAAGVQGNQALQQKQQAHHDETQASEDAGRVQAQQKAQLDNQNAANASAQQSARAMQLRQLAASSGLGASGSVFTSAQGLAPQGGSNTGGKSLLGL